MDFKEELLLIIVALLVRQGRSVAMKKILQSEILEIFTAGLLGITEGIIPRFGGAAPVWSMNQRNVISRPFRSWDCRLW